MKRKTTNKYYFSVEGETEKWYLDWLQKTINRLDSATHKVNLDVKVEKSPISRVKGISITDKTEITHIIDIESQDKEHQSQFQNSLNEMKKAEKKGKGIEYRLGYSNFTFELWIILHKAECNAPLYHRSNYLSRLNQAYGKSFSSLSEYKEEANFKSLLEELSIEDVQRALENAEKIMKANEADKTRTLQNYKGYAYYKENPSLSIHEVIKKVLKDCKIL